MVKTARTARQLVISVTQGIVRVMYRLSRGSARSQDSRRRRVSAIKVRA
jgi:hypothetical protein